MRKPSDAPDSFWPLRRGHLVAIMAREGPPQADGVATFPVHFAGLHGWIRADAVEELPASELPPPVDVLWQALAAAAPAIPPTCDAGVLLADLDGTPGDEVIVHGIGTDRCQRVLGVLAKTSPPQVLGWLTGDVIERVEARPLAGGPTFLETATFWQRDVRWTGSALKLWLLPASPGPLVAAYAEDDRTVDARATPTVYTMGRVAWPADPASPGRWLLHRRSTRRTTEDGVERDAVTERVLRWDGARFVETPAPPGLPPIPPEPPSIVPGDADPRAPSAAPDGP